MMVSSALPDLTMTSVKVFWRGVRSDLGEQLGHAEHAVHRRADLMAHIGQKFRLGAVSCLGLEQGLGGLRKGATDRLFHRPENPEGGDGKDGDQKAARPQKQPVAGGVGQMAFVVHGSAGPDQHRLGKQIALVADLAIAPFIDLLRHRHKVEVANHVARRPEQIAVHGCRIEFVDGLGREARPYCRKLGGERFNFAGQAFGMAARRCGETIACFRPPGSAGCLGETCRIAQVAGEGDEIAAQHIDIVTEGIHTIERNQNDGGSQRENQQSRQVANPDRPDEERIFRHAQPQPIRITLMGGITLHLH